MDTLQQQKSDLLSLDFTHKCSQNAGNGISETLNSNIFWRRIPPDLPTYVNILWGPKCFSRTGAHTHVVTSLTKTSIKLFKTICAGQETVNKKQ